MSIFSKEFDSFLTEPPKELDSWLDKDFLIKISEEIVNLEDYVPKSIELNLPNYEERSDFLDAHEYLVDDEFLDKQILDQRAAGTTWEEHISIYQDFFRKHPQFKKLIKDQDAYDKWMLEEPPIFYI